MHKPDGQAREKVDKRYGYQFRESLWKQPPPGVYNPNVPIETFDFIITDECHRPDFCHRITSQTEHRETGKPTNSEHHFQEFQLSLH